jgi:hypothetical protein
MAENQCPTCGAPLPAHSPGGHCPRCLLLRGIDSDPPGSDRGSNDPTPDRTARPGSVLDLIGATTDGVPRVLLRDTADGEEPSPIIRPIGGEEPSIRYRIDGEIARGGMGAILRGRDPDLGRDVAIKVLREDLRGNGDLVRRFVEEAQIGGQLQHPGVVPIYELGTFADRRPFFSMRRRCPGQAPRGRTEVVAIPLGGCRCAPEPRRNPMKSVVERGQGDSRLDLE